MCGRYILLPDAKAWTTVFGLPDAAAQQISMLSPNYNVAPTQDVPILRNNHETGDRELTLAR